MVQDWDDVYEVYASRDWMRALDALEAFADEYPDDVLAGIYLDRVVGFMLEPPSETWDGSSISAQLGMPMMRDGRDVSKTVV